MMVHHLTPRQSRTYRPGMTRPHLYQYNGRWHCYSKAGKGWLMRASGDTMQEAFRAQPTAFHPLKTRGRIPTC